MRSKFEEKVAKELRRLKVKYRYEIGSISYISPVFGGICNSCGCDDVGRWAYYTPDFWLPDLNIYLESKGKFTGPMRTKHLAVRASNKDFDVRFVFMRDNYLTKAHKAKYSDWCDRNEFKWCVFPDIQGVLT